MAIDIRDEGRRFSGYVGAEVRGEAARQKISVAALSRLMKMDRSTLNRYLTGERAFPVDALYEAAEVLDCDPGWLATQAYERFLRENPDVDYREHGAEALEQEAQPKLTIVDGHSKDTRDNLSVHNGILAASTDNYDNEAETWQQEP